MKHTASSSAARSDAPALRKVLGWSLMVAIGATVAASLVVSLATRAIAQTAPAAPAPVAAVPSAPSPSSNLAPVLASTMAHSCAACHGTNGDLGDEYFMPLAGMPVQQFVRTMTDFREGKRAATLMGHVARGFTDADLQAMGEFFAAVKPLSVAAQGAQ
ncbi:MAG: cytochrome c class I [Hydrogenophaga sp.]|uniref:c-type cytochrome n=1 Tax=Hydrogenophaga sp. TaxID=1904254 RepID=UPI00272F0156|nr:cytochrome c class I [Hydrogenophaga sp.]MDP2408260.1 cytochrome c class I [Hydrogenophaga sp.]MDZ4177414.1 cytochrome c class I [Hydrogenophaga sp.]